jgi:flagellar biosynthesis GTPase FlhF
LLLLQARTASGAKDSDFDYSDNEEDQGSQLCNTMLMVGPHGVGKTAAVYALASQFSYKVWACKKKEKNEPSICKVYKY